MNKSKPELTFKFFGCEIPLEEWRRYLRQKKLKPVERENERDKPKGKGDEG